MSWEQGWTHDSRSREWQWPMDRTTGSAGSRGWPEWHWPEETGSVPGSSVDAGSGGGPGGWVGKGRGGWVDNSLGQQEPQSRESRMDLPGIAPPGNQTAVSVAGASDAAALHSLEFFANFENWTNTYKQNNVALKCVRDSAEDAGHVVINFSNTDPHLIRKIVHAWGTDYHFEGRPRIPWRWQEMVAQLDAESLEWVVHGLQSHSATLDLRAGNVAINRSRGIVGCRLQKTTVYDHTRHCAMPWRKRDDMKVWDFVLECGDGTLVFLHPNFGNTKFGARRGEPERDNQLPRGGPGGSDGPGTFTRITQKQVERVLKFDCSKYSRYSRYFTQY